VIVVVGSPIGRFQDDIVVAGGMASRVALAAAGTGRTVQLVGRTGDDPTADAVVLDLARGGVGHVALLRDSARATPMEALPVGDAGHATDAADAGRAPSDDLAEDVAPDHDGDPTAVGPRGTHDDPRPDPGPALEAADVDLGLRYLTGFAVVAVAEPAAPDLVAVVAEAARWAEARMILVVGAGETVPEGLPPDVTVFEAPDTDTDGVFAALVGNFAASLDGGTEPGEAFRASIASEGWTGAGDDR
jgi:hypothetical protein